MWDEYSMLILHKYPTPISMKWCTFVRVYLVETSWGHPWNHHVKITWIWSRKNTYRGVEGVIGDTRHWPIWKIDTRHWHRNSDTCTWKCDSDTDYHEIPTAGDDRLGLLARSTKHLRLGAAAGCWLYSSFMGCGPQDEVQLGGLLEWVWHHSSLEVGRAGDQPGLVITDQPWTVIY